MEAPRGCLPMGHRGCGEAAGRVDISSPHLDRLVVSLLNIAPGLDRRHSRYPHPCRFCFASGFPRGHDSVPAPHSFHHHCPLCPSSGFGHPHGQIQALQEVPVVERPDEA